MILTRLLDFVAHLPIFGNHSHNVISLFSIFNSSFDCHLHVLIDRWIKYRKKRNNVMWMIIENEQMNNEIKQSSQNHVCENLSVSRNNATKQWNHQNLVTEFKNKKIHIVWCYGQNRSHSRKRQFLISSIRHLFEFDVNENKQSFWFSRFWVFD